MNQEKFSQNCTTKVKEATHKWISHKEYDAIKQRNLSYPTEHAVKHFGNILKKIKSDLLKKYSFDFVTCERHPDAGLECFLTDLRIVGYDTMATP